MSSYNLQDRSPFSARSRDSSVTRPSSAPPQADQPAPSASQYSAAPHEAAPPFYHRPEHTQSYPSAPPSAPTHASYPGPPSASGPSAPYPTITAAQASPYPSRHEWPGHAAPLSAGAHQSYPQSSQGPSNGYPAQPQLQPPQPQQPQLPPGGPSAALAQAAPYRSAPPVAGTQQAPPAHYSAGPAAPHGPPLGPGGEPYPPTHAYPYDAYYRPPYDARAMYAAPSPAPRQRTAIACKYCRKRKIRCSGFESPEGRCSNCVRFSQECIFAPVQSQQAQAFVPYNAYLNSVQGRETPQLFGAYGQPLRPEHAQYGRGPGPSPTPNYLPPAGPAPYPPHANYSYPPLPPHSSDAHATVAQIPPAAAAASAQNPDTFSHPSDPSKKRVAEESLPPNQPPPNPAVASNLPRTIGSELQPDYRYSVDANAGPSTSQASSHHAYYAPPRQDAASPQVHPKSGSMVVSSASTIVSAPHGQSVHSTSHGSVNGSGNDSNSSPTASLSTLPPPPPPPPPSNHPLTSATTTQLIPASTAGPNGTCRGRASPASHATTQSGQRSPSGSHVNGRSGMSISNILGDAGHKSPDIDSAMKARLGSAQPYATK